MGKRDISIAISDILITIIIILTIINRETSLDFVSMWKYGIIILLYLFIRLFAKTYKFSVLWGIVVIGLMEAVIAFLQKIYVLDSNHTSFEITGTFTNPSQLAGLLCVCLTICVGLLFYYIDKRLRLFILILVVCAGMMFIAILLSDSRASLLASIIGLISLCYLYNRYVRDFIKNNEKFISMKAVVLLVLIVSIWGLYQHKKDSADGRLFIWNNTIEMIKEKPILGYGTGGWVANYMYYQADYFKEYPDSDYRMLADDVAYPYNELLHLWVDQGIIGVSLIICLLYNLLFYKSSNKLNAILKCALVSFVVFSFFSYPTDTFGLMILLCVLMGSLDSRIIFVYPIPKVFFYSNFISVFLLIGFLSLWSYHIYEKTLSELFKPERQVRSEMKTTFLDLNYTSFCNNPYVMDLYAQYSFKYYSSEKAERILQSAICLRPSSDLYCNIGDVYKAQKKYSVAEGCYQIAGHMIPARITPNYNLFILYVEQNDSINALKIGNAILCQATKVEGTKTLKMKANVMQFVESCNSVSLLKN
ncbi:O-antigen ligase [Bacteroides sp. 51]|uniref:O-antigen ligase family protein n=1 Tax=Bacteroides sp. 51 TaxID=2302938 RepID=UPI0013D86D38|nr:O-antigen ligase [Bacteroides sp. 51]NDV81875.1 O-antigen ligase family protein [Bacteroides sp. 51]